MRIDAELTGDWKCNGIKYYVQSNTRMAVFSLDVKVEESEAAAQFGEEFHRIVFGLMLLQDGIVKHAQGSIKKPALVPERHVIQMLGHKVKATPELGDIRLIEGEAAAVVPIIIPIGADKGQEAIIGAFGVRVGDVIKAKFNTKELDLPGTGGPEIRKKDAGFGNKVPVKK